MRLVIDTLSTEVMASTVFYPGFVSADLVLGDYTPVHQTISDWIIVCQYCGTEWTESLCPGCGGNARKKIKVEKESA